MAVGRRVRALRTARGWTLDETAERSGVSRRMIINVEAGASNASLATLLRLSGALHVSLADLVSDTSDDDVVVTPASPDRSPLWRGEHGGHAVLVASADTPDMLELWEWVLEPGDAYSSEAHRPGTRELLHVLSGQVNLTVNDVVTALRSGDGASFAADVPHTYACTGKRPARFTMTVLEPLTRVRP